MQNPYAQGTGNMQNPYAQGTGNMQNPYAQGTGNMQNPYAQGTGNMQNPYSPDGGAVPYFPQGTPQQPAENPPKKKGRVTVFHVGIVIAILGLIGWYIYNNSGSMQAVTATVRAGMLGSYHTGDALIVRNEIPFDADGVTQIYYIAEEGTYVTRNTRICSVYSSGFSTRELTTLQDFRDQIRDYQRTLLQAETTYDAKMERVETDVLTRAREVRQIISGIKGSLSNQEKLLQTAITTRQQYLKQKYSTDQRLSRLYDDEQAQLQRIESWIKTYIATRDSLISYYSDGYEYGLTNSSVKNFTASEVRSMIRGNRPAGTSLPKSKTTIYRAVMDDGWYVIMLINDPSWNPEKGSTLQLQLERFENTMVETVIDDSSRSGNELMVRLYVSSSVLPVLNMRTCTARLGEYVNAMMVPSQAISRYGGEEGVLVEDGNSWVFVPVNRILNDGDNVFVTSLYPGLLYEGQTVKLRWGDEMQS